MPKTMRLIDAHPICLELSRLRDAYERRGDARAEAALSYALALIDDAPQIPLMVDAEKIKADKNKKKPYGEYKNVLLSDSELDKLREEFPHDWEARIEAVSDYAAASGKKYKNFLAVIRNWARREEEERAAEGKTESSFDTDEFAALAMARSYGGKS